MRTENYEEKVGEITRLSPPEFKDLWNLKNNLLEDSNAEDGSSPRTKFPDYKVTTVRLMIKNLIMNVRVM